jgi:uncharacterized membrane protein YphA (DoxX/SURF4 family)
LLPLRAFLGFTFCFAGLQKLANPRFFDAADPASIQSQLAAAARRSPVHALISPLAHVAVPLGVLIAFGELAVGVGTLLGLRARLAAAGGLALSLMLFLTVSFHSAPYQDVDEQMTAKVTLLLESPDRLVAQYLLTVGIVGNHGASLLMTQAHDRAPGWPAQEAEGPAARDFRLGQGAATR